MLTRLAVWGDPIAHSRSPQLHAAAYRALGLDWEYDRRRVAEDEFDAALAGLDAAWRGLSLTMPLKGTQNTYKSPVVLYNFNSNENDIYKNYRTILKTRTFRKNVSSRIAL